MSIDKRLLLDLTDEVDQLHHESMRTFREEAEELHFGDESLREQREARRGFMTKVGVGGALLTAGALASPIAGFMPAAFAQGGLDDAAIATFAMTVEYAAVEAYKAAAGSGKLEPAVVTIGTTFAGHHKEHGDAFAGIVKATAADKKPNAAILKAFGPKLAAAKDQAALLEIAYTIEEAAAATYLFALGALTDKAHAAATATILPIESQHAVVLATALKKPLADYLPSFQTTKNALDPAKFPA
ncbi:MAG: ferritin-like domain protein [Acidimicrobiales bacterium]|nr:ferritin-like domain protein [Acidimicrobiales bacterium]